MRLIQALELVWRTADERQRTATINREDFLIEEALVTSLMEDGRLTVKLEDKEVVATPVTDEPFEVSMRVWVSRTKEGVIVHGSIK